MAGSLLLKGLEQCRLPLERHSQKTLKIGNLVEVSGIRTQG